MMIDFVRVYQKVFRRQRITTRTVRTKRVSKRETGQETVFPLTFLWKVTVLSPVTSLPGTVYTLWR